VIGVFFDHFTTLHSTLLVVELVHEVALLKLLQVLGVLATVASSSRIRIEETYKLFNSCNNTKGYDTKTTATIVAAKSGSIWAMDSAQPGSTTRVLGVASNFLAPSPALAVRAEACWRYMPNTRYLREC
jgi:hypothetical protein